jgi:hypothetical protein
MKSTNRQRVSALLAAGIVALGAAAASVTAGSAFKQVSTDQQDQPAASSKDKIVLRDGRILEGRILSENDQQIEFEIVVAGIVGTRTVNRSDILNIEKASTPDTTGKTGDKTTTTAPAKPTTTANADTSTKVYFIPLSGEFSRDVALSPMKRVMEDAKRLQPDVLVVKLDCGFKIFGNEMPEWSQNPGVYDQLELAREMEPMLTEQIQHDPDWKTKPHLVFWVKRALGGAAFLPFFCKEIYYTSDAKHGGIGYLDYLFAGVGDEVVREKQRSLRQGRLEGLAIMGGHPVEIIRAMARVDYVLSADFEGGKPVFREDLGGEMPLTDDGNMQEGRRDTIDEIIRFTGNDVLTLTAATAERLGMSNGTVDTNNQLYDKLGITRANPTEVGRAKDILEEWSKGVTEAEFSIRRLWREYGKVEVKDPGGYNERTAARGRRKAILKDILALLEKYGEAINPQEIRSYPEDMKKKIHIEIEILEQEQRRDKPDRK